VIENYPYPVACREIAAGEWICVVTDGVTEAMNEAGALYGVARLQAVLQSLAEGIAPANLLAAVRADVSRFVGAAEPSDDLTLLCLRWNGRVSAAREDEKLADADLNAPVARLGDLVIGRD
jgi:serine phosphatase RsbU (regulator of sigma subunit)